MFEFRNNEFHISRKEAGDITFVNKDGEFASGDTIELKVYEKNGLDEQPVLYKLLEISNAGTSATLTLYGEDTELGDPGNEVVEYWYEIKLNGETTLLGYDDKGPKMFYLYPSGMDKVN